MQLSEMIETVREDYLADTTRPYLWSDNQIRRAINAAQVDACRRARLIIDDQTFRMTFDGPRPVALDKRIIYVRRVVPEGGAPLRRISQRDLDEQQPGWETTVGEPRGYVIDAATFAMRLYPALDGITPLTVQLTVVREPLDPLTEDTDEPEIPDRYLSAVFHGACERLYMRPDIDGADAQKAAYHASKFAEEFGKPSTAIDETWIRENYDYAAAEGVF